MSSCFSEGNDFPSILKFVFLYYSTIVASVSSFSIAPRLVRESRVATRMLLEAIDGGNTKRVLSLMSTGKIDVNAQLPPNEELLTPSFLLFFAACHGQLEIVKILLDAGANINDVNVNNNLRETACHVAARANHPHVVALLIARGADLAILDANGYTALCSAVYERNEGITIALIKGGSPIVPRTACLAASISTEVITLLLEKQIDIKTIRGETDFTPIHFAVMRHWKEKVIEMLVKEVGVDINARDGRGNTCSHNAINCNNSGALMQLIELGADIEVKNNLGRTPLHIACAAFNPPCVTLLLAAGADTLAKTPKGNTPLHVAVRQAAAKSVPVQLAHQVLEALLACGGDFDAIDESGDTVRVLAAARGIVEPTADRIVAARRHVTLVQFERVRGRAFEVCVGLHGLRLDALQMCEILTHSCGSWGPFVPFHIWWHIATTAKHFPLLADKKKPEQEQKEQNQQDQQDQQGD